MHALCELTPMTTDIIEAVGTVQKLLREQVFATLEEEEKIFMHQSGNNKGQERFRLSDGFMLETDRNKAANFVKVCGTWYLPRLAVVVAISSKSKAVASDPPVVDRPICADVMLHAGYWRAQAASTARG
jgi:hypothetical protein